MGLAYIGVPVRHAPVARSPRSAPIFKNSESRHATRHDSAARAWRVRRGFEENRIMANANETRIKRSIDVAAGTVTFNVPGFSAIVVRLADCAPEVQQYAPLAGLNHTCGDAAALETKGGHRPTMEEKWTAIRDRAEQLKTAWNSERDVEETSILAEAVQRVSKAEMDDVVALLATLSAEEKKEMARSKEVGMEMLKIRRDRQYAKLEAAPKSDVAAGILARLKKAK